jgi:hypothetical protein
MQNDEFPFRCNPFEEYPIGCDGGAGCNPQNQDTIT